ncbi:hypothetical protein [Desulfonatronovibrio hydrogenovorans]|uniref:hypothetical protein n=1 Tax=Desulfonatronovibrio hydrogenovorans TaxID=53245 RepID=UPI00049034FA|nr:hypothetical protein [Desulfonatronovibrio hydrogenovorans]
MNKDEMHRQINAYRVLMEDIKKEFNRIDPELPDKVQKQRKQAVREKYGRKAIELACIVQAGKKHFQSVRARASDPALSIFKASYQREIKPQVAALLDSLDIFAPEKLVEICRLFKDPHLILKAQKVISNQEFTDPKHKGGLLNELRELTKEFTDQAEARSAAEIEFAAVQAQLQALDLIEGSLEDKMTLGREFQAIKQILDSGQEPGPGLSRSEFAADPKERLRQAYAQ